LLAKFEQQLRFIKTAPAIRQVIMAQITGWLNSEQHPLSGSHSAGIRCAVAYQMVLGWEQFLKGRITFHWAILLDFEFLRCQQRNTGTSWAAQLVRETWDLSWSIWDHCNEILHTSDVQDKLLGDMDSIDFAIIEEWHAGSDTLWTIDRRQLKTQSGMDAASFVSVGISSFGMFTQHKSYEVKGFEPFWTRTVR
jgi:hypothetical protein